MEKISPFAEFDKYEQEPEKDCPVCKKILTNNTKWIIKLDGYNRLVMHINCTTEQQFFNSLYDSCGGDQIYSFLHSDIFKQLPETHKKIAQEFAEISQKQHNLAKKAILSAFIGDEEGAKKYKEQFYETGECTKGTETYISDALCGRYRRF